MPRARRRARRAAGPVALRMTPMIDAVFLLLAYFLLAAEFREPEGAVSASAAAPPDAVMEDPLELPARPVRIRVRSVGTAEHAYELVTDAPELSHTATAGALRRAAAASLGPVFGPDQLFIISCHPDTLWEHALAVAGAIDAAGYDVVRFEESQR